jgi:ankyrin repeat protein
MGFFRSIFGKRDKNEVTNETDDIIGGFFKKDLDKIKATYRPDNGFTARSKVYNIKKSEVLELLQKGFNPNYIENSAPIFLRSENIDVLRVLEYFGADTRFETDILGKTGCIGRMNPNLVDFFKDILLKIDQSKLTQTTDLKVIERFHEIGISFKPQKKKYESYKMDYIWWSLIRFDQNKDFKMSENDFKISQFILNKTDFSFEDEVSYVESGNEKKVFVWHLYFKWFLSNESKQNPKAYNAFFDIYKKNIDYSKKSSEDFSLFDIIDFEDITKNEKEITHILKKHGLDFENYKSNFFERRKTSTNNKVSGQNETTTSSETDFLDIDEEKDKKTIIEQSTLDEIKTTYKPNALYSRKADNYKGERYYTLPRHRIVEALSKGLDPNQFIAFYSSNEGIVPFMMVSHVEDLAILEQFGADIHLKTDLKNKIKALNLINFKLFDHYQEFLLSTSLKYVSKLFNRDKLEWFKDKGYDFTMPLSYSKIQDVPLWEVFTRLHYKEPILHSPEIVAFIQQEFKVSINLEVKVKRKNVEYNYLYWFLLFALQVRDYSFLTPAKCMEDLSTLIDIYKNQIDLNAKTSDDRSFYSALEVIPERLQKAFIETLYSKGIHIELENSKDQILVKKQEDPEFCEFFKELKISYSNETTFRFKGLDVIGGIQRSILDEIKSAQEVKDFKYYDFVTPWGERKKITSENISSILKMGFNPAHPNDDFPLFLIAENQDILDVFEYMGAPVNKSIRQYPFKHLHLISSFMFERYIDDFMRMEHNIFMNIFKVTSLELLKQKGLDFDKAQNGSESGWKCFEPYRYEDEDRKAARTFLVEECGLDFNANLVVSSPFKKLNAWFLYGKSFFGNGIIRERKEREANTTQFERFLNEYKDKFSIFDLTENRENFYFAFADASPTYLTWIVEYLLNRFGLNPYFENNEGLSLVDYIGKNGDKYKKLLEYLEQHPCHNDHEFSKTTNNLSNFDSFSTESKSRLKENKESIIHEGGSCEKRQRDDDRYDGIFLLELLQNDIIYFHEDEIIYDGKNHSVKEAWFNEKEIYKFPNILANGRNVVSQIIDFCDYVESNPKLIIDSSKIGKNLLVHLYGENLTGLLTINLFADHFLKVLKLDHSGKNIHLMVETRFISSVPRYKEYLHEFIQTVINYNPIFGENFSISETSFWNVDIGEPKRKKRPSSKKKAVKKNLDEEIAVSLFQEKNFEKFVKLTENIDLNNFKMANNLSLLHVACAQNLTDFAIYLIDRSIDVNIATTENLTGSDRFIKSIGVAGVTALLLASQNQNETIVKALLNAGANPNLSSKNKQTPLMKVSQKNNATIANILCEYGARLDDRNEEGQTALHQASEENYIEVAKILINHGASINIENSNFLTPIAQSIIKGNLEMIELLFESKGNLDYERKIQGLGFGSALFESILNKNYSRNLLDILLKHNYPVAVFKSGFHIITAFVISEYSKSEISYFSKKIMFDESDLSLFSSEIEFSKALEGDFLEFFWSKISTRDFVQLKNYLLKKKININFYTFFMTMLLYYLGFSTVEGHGLDEGLKNIKSVLDFYKYIGSTIDIVDAESRFGALMDMVANLEKDLSFVSNEMLIKTIELLLHEGINVNASDGQWTALDLAMNLTDKDVSREVEGIIRKYGGRTFGEYYLDQN